jgi:8-oxo-dGTP pyrophosphatase MutT (NUDIX family)
MTPWKRLARTLVVDSRWLRVSADRCALPDGRIVEPFYVVHEPEWVHVFAVNAAGELLVVRQYRYAADAVCTELPGGVVDAGESPAAAAKRELLEETGHEAGNLQPVGWLFANPARQTNRVHLFIATGLRAVARQQLDAQEDISCRFMPLQEVPRAIEAGEFAQALHVASYYRALSIWQGHGTA